MGTAFLVLASLRFLVDLLGWMVWKLGNAEPVVSFFFPRGQGAFLAADRFFIRHFPTVVAVQGTVAAVVVWISIGFLRLRPWARPALELVAWIGVMVVTALLGVFAFTWTRLSSAPIARPLAVAIAVLLALDLLLGAAIRVMRATSVRTAFRDGARPGTF